MKKGYTLEIVDREHRRSDFYHFTDLGSLEQEREQHHKTEFCIVTEWAQFEYGLGDYEVEIARYNW